QEKMKSNITNPLIEINNLSVEFHTSKSKVKALNNVSLTLQPSETVAILGESGSGKSTTALALMGLLPRPTGKIVSGEMYLEGKNLVELNENERRKLYGSKLSIIFQDPLSALNPV